METLLVSFGWVAIVLMAAALGATIEIGIEYFVDWLNRR